jgi:GT2 family glycosyltransferase
MRSSAALAPSVAPVVAPSGRAAVVIVTYNGSAHVGTCLRSLLVGEIHPSQILVVDNASGDGTVDLVRRGFPAVRLLRVATNLGYGAASNRGVRSCPAEYLAIMNQDVVSTAGWIDRLVSALDEAPMAALATPKILVKDEPSRVNACGNTPHYTGITWCHGYGRPSGDFGQREDVAAVSGAAFVMRRTVFEELGGFDPDFFLYLEDTDLSLRAALAGYRCLLVPDAVVLHDFEPRFSADKLFFLERNRHAMLVKLYRWRTLLVLMPALLLTEVAVWGYAVLGGRRHLWAKVRACAWVLVHLRAILRARRQTQATRRLPDQTLLQRFAADLHVDELGRSSGWLVAAVMNPLLRGWYQVARVAVRW